MKKILFLDIDGVLNSFDSYSSYDKLWAIDNDFKSRDQYGQLFDERCVRWLRYIIEKTDCKIVVSSSWRKNGLLSIQAMWEDRKLAGEVIDITPFGMNDELEEEHGEEAIRGHKIQDWLNKNECDTYCIVDDRSDMMEHQIHVKTNKRYGLDYKTSRSIIEHLNRVV